MKFVFFMIGIFLAVGCSIHRPCQEGGDVSWIPEIRGDRRCAQKENKKGETVNHGPYQQYYVPSGRLALEGEFDEGRKNGIWIHYAEDGNLKAVKYFEGGIEKTPPSEVQVRIDRLIQAKTLIANPR